MTPIPAHNLLDGVPSMVERLSPRTLDEFVVADEILVLMEPSMNVSPKCCALLLRAMARIDARGE